MPQIKSKFLRPTERQLDELNLQAMINVHAVKDKHSITETKREANLCPRSLKKFQKEIGTIDPGFLNRCKKSNLLFFPCWQDFPVDNNNEHKGVFCVCECLDGWQEMKVSITVINSEGGIRVFRHLLRVLFDDKNEKTDRTKWNSLF